MAQIPWRVDWNEALVLGIPEIDADHQRFASLVNDLNLAIMRRASKDEVRKKLDLLYLDARAHFQHEERLFAQHAYPEHEGHARLHRQIEAAIMQQFAVFKTTDFGKEWMESGLRIKGLLVNHLLQEDMKYREFMQFKMGIKAAD